MDNNQKQQAADRIKQANNILVTVSSNPSVDQLAACIGLTLTLNKMGKHATAVFSGAVPSTIEFLQPEKTIEKNTDSLRDFIIALDKSKADKLRYKVEDRVVKIFITPYRTSINEKDLEFSQGDFNVDVVVALGVHSQAELDQAITSHGRILHDATVITMNVKPGGELGGINWLDPSASSLSELAVQLIDLLDKKLIDNQVATALLTGIVAETERFSNAKTSPQTMSISAELMGAGANQQLVATKLEEPVVPPPAPAAPIAHQEPTKPAEPEQPAKPDDGTLEIAHDDKSALEPQPEQKEESKEETPSTEPKPEEKAEEKPEEQAAPAEAAQPQPEEKKEEPKAEEKLPPIAPQIHIDEHGSLKPLVPEPAESEAALLPPKLAEVPTISHHSQPPKMIIEPPTLGGQLTAAGKPEDDASTSTSLPSLEAPSLITPAPAPSPQEPAVNSLNSTDELPSGGAQPGGSFIVGDEPKIISPTSISPVPPVPPVQEPAPLGGLSASLPPLIPDLPISDQSAVPQPSLPEPESRTLSDIEHDVHSSHLDQPPTPPALPDLPSFAPPQPAAPAGIPSASSTTDNSANNLLPPLPTTDLASTPTPSTPAPPLDDLLGGISGSTPAPSGAPTSPFDQPIDKPAIAPAADADAAEAPTVDSARNAVEEAINSASTPDLQPIASLNAQPVDLPLGGSPAAGADQPAVDPVVQPPLDASAPTLPQFGMPEMALPPTPQPQFGANPADQAADPNAPPPVPPPMMPPANPY
jgi:hypothetical protein